MIELKKVENITRSNEVVALFAEVSTLGVSLNSKLLALGIALADQVKALTMPTTSKAALIEATYAGEFGKLDRNASQILRAIIVSKLAPASVQIEIAPPSKDGKKAAVFKTAATLSPNEAKKFAKEVKEQVREVEATPTEKAEAKAKAAEAEKQAQATKDAQAKAIAIKRHEEAFAYCLSEDMRPQLIERLKAIGLKLAKITTAPAK